MAIFNPNTRNLIVLSVKLRSAAEEIDYLFPLNPNSLTTNQASRVSATFTYGAKVFQNLGAGLKTISIEGHTGYRMDYAKYGTRGFTSDLASGAEDLSDKASPQAGKKHWLDLYALIQLIKGENKFIRKFASISDTFSVDNIDNIESVKLTVPDQGITYDVLLQNDSFLRNREQPHLYKYKLDFIVVQEFIGAPRKREEVSIARPDLGTTVNFCKKMVNDLKSIKDGIKKAVYAIPFAKEAFDLVEDGFVLAEQSTTYANFFITQANSAISDLRRLERMTDAVNKVSANVGLIKGVVLQLKTFSSLQAAFYEPYVSLKHLKSQLNLLKTAMRGEQEQLAFNVNLTRLASISAPVTVAANKATVAQFQKDIRQLSRITFPLPVDRVEEITTDGVTKINVFFKTAPSSLGVSGMKIFVANDFGSENDLVESFSDSNLVMSTNYNTSGFLYNFVIEYNYTTFESIVQPRYKSIKRILIQKGETIETIVKKYAASEANYSQSYLSEVAYLNRIEYPYVVTSDNPNFEAYFGSYGYKIFTTRGEFLRYINNIDTTIYNSVDLPVYDVTDSLASNYIDLDDPAKFLLQQQELIDQIRIEPNTKFFVLLFKETYSNRCYALFGIFNSTNALPYKLFNADSYVICALEKGRSYDVDNNALFEILSPYTATGDLVEYYGQTAYFETLTDTLFNNLVSVIDQIYIANVGSFVQVGSFPFTQDDKTFLSGDLDNANYVILTNFTAAGALAYSEYSIAAFSVYKILTDGQEILLPSLENTFLPFTEAFSREDTYKVDLDVRFHYLDDVHVSILPRPDLGPGPNGYEQGYLDFRLISGLDNIKQAIMNRLECPQGGLILHRDYGLPVLLGKKNTLEHLILLRYNLFNQLMSDLRVRSVDDMQLKSVADYINAQASITLVNNDETIVKTTL
jgi:hypothetical protein